MLPLAILFSLLLWCAGDPNRMLRTVLLVGPIAALYAALVVGGVIAFFGWPILWLFEQILGLSPDVERWTSSLVQLNYLSIGLVIGAAMAVVIVLLVRGIWNEQGKAQRAFDKKESYLKQFGGDETVRLDELESVQAVKPELPSPRDYGRISTNYRRIGLIVGSLFAVVPILSGLVLAHTELTFSFLMYCALATIILFVIPYGICRSLGWILDGFLSKAEAGSELKAAKEV